MSGSLENNPFFCLGSVVNKEVRVAAVDEALQGLTARALAELGEAHDASTLEAMRTPFALCHGPTPIRSRTTMWSLSSTPTADRSRSS